MNSPFSTIEKYQRVQIENLLDQMSITIGWSRKFKHLFLGGLWILYWWSVTFIIFCMGYGTIGIGFFQEKQFIYLFFIIPLVIGLIIWSVRGVISFKAILQQFILNEIVQLSSDGIRITKKFLFFKVSKEYLIEEIGVFCAMKPETIELPFSKFRWTTLHLPATGVISFRWKMEKRIYFGMELDQADAEMIVRVIQRKFERVSRYRPELVN